VTARTRFLRTSAERLFRTLYVWQHPEPPEFSVPLDPSGTRGNSEYPLTIRVPCVVRVCETIIVGGAPLSAGRGRSGRVGNGLRKNAVVKMQTSSAKNVEFYIKQHPICGESSRLLVEIPS